MKAKAVRGEFSRVRQLKLLQRGMDVETLSMSSELTLARKSYLDLISSATCQRSWLDRRILLRYLKKRSGRQQYLAPYKALS